MTMIRLLMMRKRNNKKNQDQRLKIGLKILMNTKPFIENLDQYDTIILGYPNWWGDMPMILYAFFDDYNLSNRTIAPFCTSGESRLLDTEKTIQVVVQW